MRCHRLPRSVGYRVKSRRGVEFRRWATDVLRRYITEGYAANDRRLRELGQVVNVMARLPEGDLATRQIFDIIRSYTTALDLLDDYDNQTIGRPQGTEGSYVLDFDECRDVIASMRFGNESSLFGVEKDDSFRASKEHPMSDTQRGPRARGARSRRDTRAPFFPSSQTAPAQM